MQRAAQFVADSLRAAGLENVEIIPTAKHPLVYADWLHAPGKPTVLCYGHYDVQPPDPLELWTTPPFEPALRDGNLYARGSADDKGQMYMHIKAVEALRAVNGTLARQSEIPDRRRRGNRRRIGREVCRRESGEAQGRRRAGLRHRTLRRRDSDAVHRPARPDLHRNRSARPGARSAFGHVRRRRAQRRLRAGRAAREDERRQRHIQIPGMYDDVEPPTARRETELGRRLPFDEKDFLKTRSGLDQLTGEPGYSVLERVWARPTLEVHGIAGGFTGGRREDRDSGEGHRQSQHADGAQSGSRKNHRGV